MTTHIPTLQEVINVVTLITYAVTLASAILKLPFVPHPEKAEGKLGKLLKILNWISMNLNKLDRED